MITVIALIVWAGAALMVGLILGLAIADADRNEQPEPVEVPDYVPGSWTA